MTEPLPVLTQQDLSHFQILGYIGGLIVTAFVAGAAMKSKLNAAVSSIIEEVKKDMSSLTIRVEKLEQDHVSHAQIDKVKEVHDKDMDKMFSLFNELRQILKEGFDSVNKRVDSIYPLLARRREDD